MAAARNSFRRFRTDAKIFRSCRPNYRKSELTANIGVVAKKPVRIMTKQELISLKDMLTCSNKMNGIGEYFKFQNQQQQLKSYRFYSNWKRILLKFQGSIRPIYMIRKQNLLSIIDKCIKNNRIVGNSKQINDIVDSISKITKHYLLKCNKLNEWNRKVIPALKSAAQNKKLIITQHSKYLMFKDYLVNPRKSNEINVIKLLKAIISNKITLIHNRIKENNNPSNYFQKRKYHQKMLNNYGFMSTCNEHTNVPSSDVFKHRQNKDNTPKDTPSLLTQNNEPSTIVEKYNEIHGEVKSEVKSICNQINNADTNNTCQYFTHITEGKSKDKGNNNFDPLINTHKVTSSVKPDRNTSNSMFAEYFRNLIQNNEYLLENNYKNTRLRNDSQWENNGRNKKLAKILMTSLQLKFEKPMRTLNISRNKATIKTETITPPVQIVVPTSDFCEDKKEINDIKLEVIPIQQERGNSINEMVTSPSDSIVPANNNEISNYITNHETLTNIFSGTNNKMVIDSANFNNYDAQVRREESPLKQVTLNSTEDNVSTIDANQNKHHCGQVLKESKSAVQDDKLNLIEFTNSSFNDLPYSQYFINYLPVSKYLHKRTEDYKIKKSDKRLTLKTSINRIKGDSTKSKMLLKQSTSILSSDEKKRKCKTQDMDKPSRLLAWFCHKTSMAKFLSNGVSKNSSSIFESIGKLNHRTTKAICKPIVSHDKRNSLVKKEFHKIQAMARAKMPLSYKRMLFRSTQKEVPPNTGTHNLLLLFERSKFKSIENYKTLLNLVRSVHKRKDQTVKQPLRNKTKNLLETSKRKK